jgi:hypothetical protein
MVFCVPKLELMFTVLLLLDVLTRNDTRLIGHHSSNLVPSPIFHSTIQPESSQLLHSGKTISLESKILTDSGTIFPSHVWAVSAPSLQTLTFLILPKALFTQMLALYREQ